MRKMKIGEKKKTTTSSTNSLQPPMQKDFEKNPCVNEEKSYSFADCVGGAADGIGDADGIVLLVPAGAALLMEAFCPIV
ncbi:hypothetical protein LOK49_LG07G02163 [Camellia lanceoleosa]|uniref:Uncharacterized protein n=1 Tax=Camellia lanceoleosa TaxID=1840588 RepID=A0ACC0H6T0_9ERIC|nr:hypothetical protein LOK49_LG07G02163 [Camellia lanceoleosa]